MPNLTVVPSVARDNLAEDNFALAEANTAALAAINRCLATDIHSLDGHAAELAVTSAIMEQVRCWEQLKRTRNHYRSLTEL